MKKQELKDLIKKYIIFTITMILAAINFNLLIKPSKIISGGMNGLAMLFQDFFNISPSLFVFICSLIILILSIIILGFTKASSIILFTCLYPIFVKITSNINDIITFNSNDLMLYAIFIGIISGIVNGICFKIQLGAGPIPLVSQMINKFTNISLSKITFFLNIFIILIGGYKYGLEKILYAIISIYINSIVINKVLKSSNKIFYIITDEYEQIETYIKKELNNKFILSNTENTKLDNNKKIIMTVIPLSNYTALKNQIQKVDNNATFIVTDSYEVHNCSQKNLNCFKQI